MDDIAGLITRHGPLLISAICFTEAIGLPLPAAVALLGAGALTEQGQIPAWSFAAGLGGLLTGDLVLFAIGRYTGWYFLGLLCRLSASPESCIYNSAITFYRKGRTALLFAKFIPGLNTMAAPLAGSLNMKPQQFLAFDMAGVLIYAGTYFGAGFLFSDFLGLMLNRLATAGQFVRALLVLAAVAYVAYRVWVAWRLRVSFVDIPRLLPADAAAILRERADEVVVLDARSHGYYDRDSVRIHGSTRFEPNRLADPNAELPADKLILIYCTCLSDATSLRVARALRDRGRKTMVIQGGLQAWKKGGHPVEVVPADDLVQLPSFGR
jgi:membrane protein DedA with SNARE-associated domain/rhodanese-related sulfurtransferase